jgi:hypothetical protein
MKKFVRNNRILKPIGLIIKVNRQGGARRQ